VLDVIRFKEGMLPSKDLSGDEKFNNAKEQVIIKDQDKVRNRSILLLDDIITTCGTAHWCSSELLNAGAKEVHVLGICRTIRKKNLEFIGYNGPY
jgi:competence protein ComFC